MNNNVVIVAGLLGTSVVTSATWVAWVAGGYCALMIIATVWEIINE